MHWDYEPVTLDEILVYDDIIQKAEAELKSEVMAEAIEKSSCFPVLNYPSAILK